MKTYLLFLSILFSHFTFKGDDHVYNTLTFEKTEYGLIFTEITVKGEKVKAMIDFGDPHSLMLAHSFALKMGIKMNDTGSQISDINGNRYSLYKGEIPYLQIGDKDYKSYHFHSSPNEIENVSNQIQMEFQAVVGWGYVSKKPFTIDYKAGKIILFHQLPEKKVDFELPFDNSDGYLIIPAIMEDQPINLLVDTGSPVTVLDATLKSETNQLYLAGTNVTPSQLYYEDLSSLAGLANGLLGGDLLSRYTLLVNPSENSITFTNKSIE